MGLLPQEIQWWYEDLPPHAMYDGTWACRRVPAAEGDAMVAQGPAAVSNGVVARGSATKGNVTMAHGPAAKGDGVV